MTRLALSLFVTSVVAKGVVLLGGDVSWSAWTPVAYLWQDAGVALLFVAATRLVPSRAVAGTSYGALVLLTAVDVPIERVLGSPLTAPMINATRLTLGDSFLHEMTFQNIVGVLVVIAVGVILPVAWRAPIRNGGLLGMIGSAAVLLGPAASRRVDTGGFDRNPVVAIVQTALPRLRGVDSDADWRAARSNGAASTEDLSPLKGIAPRRNVVLVILESTAAQYLRPWGAVEDPMPNLSQLAASSIVFESAYAVYPESIKALVAILASRYPAFDVPAERHAGTMATSLATVLDSEGYATGLFHSGRFMYLGMSETLARSGFARMDDAGAISGTRNSSFGTDEPSTVSRLLEWIDSLTPGQPFLATYIPIAGHHPYATMRPGPFVATSDIGRYRNALHEGDEALGLLLAGLHRRGLDRRTLVVVLADHGEAFGQHPANFGHTFALHDENVHVPLVLSIAGSDRAVSRVRRPVSVVDVAPTILDLLGITPPREFQGESLLQPRDRMALFYTDYSLGLLGLRDGCTKFITELESGRNKLFDVCRDPDEHVNLAAERADAVSLYGPRLRGWSMAQVARVVRDDRITPAAHASIVTGAPFR